MIIEAGYDLLQLIHPQLFADDASRRALWVMAMDEDLRYLFTRKVRDVVPGTFEDAVPDLAAALRSDPFRPHYFVLAHMVPSMGSGIEEKVHHEDAHIRSAPVLAGYQLLGRMVFDSENLYSSAPRYTFRDYVGREDLPRAAVIPGPHEYLRCTCLACAQYEAKLAAGRMRHRVSDLPEESAG